jgi:hypothetical protein
MRRSLPVDNMANFTRFETHGKMYSPPHRIIRVIYIILAFTEQINLFSSTSFGGLKKSHITRPLTITIAALFQPSLKKA